MTVTHPSTSPSAAPGQALHALAVVAHRLAIAGERDDPGMPAVLAAIAALVGAGRCALWHWEEGRIAPATDPATDAGATDAGATDAGAMADAATAAAASALARRLAVAGLDAGAVARRTGRPLPPPDGEHDGLVVVPLGSDDELLGLLVLHDAPPPHGDAADALAVVAAMLAQRLAHERRARHLSAELASRARQIDDERRFTERIIDSLPLGLYVIDREYRIQAWNHKRETGLQGISREEAIGRTVFEILHRQPAEMLRREFSDVFSTGTVQNFSMESSSTGELRYYRITKIPMRAHGDEVTHVITIGEDVTDWREAQERFAQAEKLAAIGQLAAGVMHEINNPLATIAACAESLGLALADAREGGAAVPAESGEYLRIVESEVMRSKRIVDRLLEFSRPKPLAPEPVDLNAVVEQTLFLLKHHSRFKTFAVATELADPPPVARGNAEQLVQVLMALLINAMDASPASGTIEVRTRTLAGDDATRRAAIEVRDEGHGIPRGQLAKIFEPFFTTKAPGRGTGLGLSICYGIVSEHGGRLEVESEEGKGSVFRILLPEAAGG